MDQLDDVAGFVRRIGEGRHRGRSSHGASSGEKEGQKDEQDSNRMTISNRIERRIRFGFLLSVDVTGASEEIN